MHNESRLPFVLVENQTASPCSTVLCHNRSAMRRFVLCRLGRIREFTNLWPFGNYCFKNLTLPLILLPFLCISDFVSGFVQRWWNDTFAGCRNMIYTKPIVREHQKGRAGMQHVRCRSVGTWDLVASRNPDTILPGSHEFTVLLTPLWSFFSRCILVMIAFYHNKNGWENTFHRKHFINVYILLEPLYRLRTVP